MTKTARDWHKKKHLREAESNTCEQWIYLLGIEKHVTRRHTASKFGGVRVRSTTCTQRSLSRRWLKHQSVFCIRKLRSKPNLSPLLGECAALLLFLCYDIHDAVGVSDWLVRQQFSSYFLVCWYQKHSSSAKRTNYYSHCKGATITAKRREIWDRTFRLDWINWDTVEYQSPNNGRTLGY